MSLRDTDPLAGLPEGIVALNAPALARAGVLDSARVAACPPAERPGLVRALATRAAHVRAGTLARSAGAALEAWLEGQHEAALAAGLLARIRHVDPPTQEASVRCPHCSRWHPGILRTGEGPADYQGQTADGRSLAIEAKSRTRRLYLEEDLEPHQIADLEACARGGGLALLVYEHRRPDGSGLRRFAVPWTLVPWDRSRCSGSVGPAELARWLVPREGVYLAHLLGGS